MAGELTLFQIQPPRLNSLTFSGDGAPIYAEGCRINCWTRHVMPGTVVDYVVATYGSETLPDLVRGLGEYHNTESLVDGLFNVSFDAFEADWQRYVSLQ